jgi:L-serine/L-threonine ammonia-lyase
MFQVTPCVQSLEMTELAKRPIYIKLENCQATGSFKDRGIGHCIKQAYLRGHRRVVAVSAGNAGLAAAHAATTLGMPVTVVVPSTTLNLLVSRLKREGADVMVHGDTLKQSATFGTEMAAANNAFLAHPYDHPDIWEGHSTLVEELKDQLPARPAAVVVAVGGGGLMTGVLLGLEKVGWADDVAVVGVETEGTATFNASMKAGKIVGLPEDAMKSIARSIAVQKPTVSLEKYLKSPMVHSQVVSDAQSVHAVVRFADDHRFLVEPSAGAALALVYSGLVNNLSKAGALPGPPDAPIVIVICGGNSVTLDLVEEWRRKYLTTK